MSLHHPVQQVCCVEVLDQMEWFGVQPDKEVHDIVVNIFGEYNYATKKAKRMLYWLPKLKHSNPYLDRRDVENQDLNDIELARTPVTEKDPFGKWVVSGQSPLQRRLIMEMPEKTCYFVDGPYNLFVHDRHTQYIVFSGPPQINDDEIFVDQRELHNYQNLQEKLFNNDEKEKLDNVHLQSDQTILALAIMEESTQYCASAWISHLQDRNKELQTSTILVRIKEPEKEPSGLEVSN